MKGPHDPVIITTVPQSVKSSKNQDTWTRPELQGSLGSWALLGGSTLRGSFDASACRLSLFGAVVKA